MQSSRVCLVMAALALTTAMSVLPTQVASAAPNTTVVLPSNGATLSVITQYFDATASSGATQVQYKLTGGSLNNQVIATATPTYVGWAAAWNTTTVANGIYALNSVASYPGGVTAASPPITITVNNAPPSTTVVYPTSGANVDDTQTSVFFDAVASPGVTAVSLQVLIDVGSPPYPTATLPASPTIYGWIGVLGGNPCSPLAPGPCLIAQVPGGAVSVASYANGVSAPSAPVDVTFDVNEGTAP
jgi:hypothetical protein